MDPALLSLLAGSIIVLLVRVISNKRVQLIQKELDCCRDAVITLERERYKMRRELARHGVDTDSIISLPDPEKTEKEEEEDEELTDRFR